MRRYCEEGPRCRTKWRFSWGLALLVFLACPIRAAAGDGGLHAGPAMPGSHPVADLPSAIQRTALGDFIVDNGGFPRTLPELRATLDRTYGDSRSFVVPFSAAPGYTDLDEARTVYLSPAGDLYFGAIKRADGTTDFEFISRSKDTDQFDFGVIRNFGSPAARFEIVDRKNCIICHKNEGPQFYVAPWLNTLARFDPTAAADAPTTQFNAPPNPNFPGISATLHRAFLEHLTAKNPAYAEALHQAVVYDDAYHNGGTAPNFFTQSHARYEGADIAASARDVERLVYLGNQVTLLHSLVDHAPPDTRRLLLSFLLNQSLCVKQMASSSFNDPRISAFEDLVKHELLGGGLNLPVLLNPPPLSHLSGSHDAAVVFTDLEKIRSLHAKKKAARARNTIPDESPLLPENFSALVPVLGSNSYATINGMDLVEAYQASLRLSKQSRSAFCESDEYRNLLAGASLPNRDQIRAAIQHFEQAGAGTTHPGGEARACMDCHGGQIAGIQAPFDLGSLSAWQSRLNSADSAVRATAAHWLAKVNRHDVLGDSPERMPPEPYRSTLSPTEREQLRQYLKLRGE